MKNLRKWFGLLVLITVFVIGTAALFSVSTKASDANAVEVAEDVDVESESTGDMTTGLKSIAAALAIGLAAMGGGIGMGIVGGKATESISRQPDMEGSIRTTLMLDIVFIETAIIYALLVVVLIIFVL